MHELINYICNTLGNLTRSTPAFDTVYQYLYIQNFFVTDILLAHHLFILQRFWQTVNTFHWYLLILTSQAFFQSLLYNRLKVLNTKTGVSLKWWKWCFLLAYFSSEIPMKHLNSKKIKENAFSSKQDLNFKHFPFSVYYRATPQSHWTKFTVKKLIR